MTLEASPKHKLFTPRGWGGGDTRLAPLGWPRLPHFAWLLAHLALLVFLQALSRETAFTKNTQTALKSEFSSQGKARYSEEALVGVGRREGPRQSEDPAQHRSVPEIARQGSCISPHH